MQERIFFDEELEPGYEPTEEEVTDYALHVLNLQFPLHEDLRHLAVQGLKEPLHESWRPFIYAQDPTKTVYYHNHVTQKVVKQHPT